MARLVRAAALGDDDRAWVVRRFVRGSPSSSTGRACSGAGRGSCGRRRAGRAARWRRDGDDAGGAALNSDRLGWVGRAAAGRHASCRRDRLLVGRPIPPDPEQLRVSGCRNISVRFDATIHGAAAKDHGPASKPADGAAAVVDRLSTSITAPSSGQWARRIVPAYLALWAPQLGDPASLRCGSSYLARAQPMVRSRWSTPGPESSISPAPAFSRPRRLSTSAPRLPEGGRRSRGRPPSQLAPAAPAFDGALPPVRVRCGSRPGQLGRTSAQRFALLGRSRSKRSAGVTSERCSSAWCGQLHVVVSQPSSSAPAPPAADRQRVSSSSSRRSVWSTGWILPVVVGRRRHCQSVHDPPLRRQDLARRASPARPRSCGR